MKIKEVLILKYLLVDNHWKNVSNDYVTIYMNIRTSIIYTTKLDNLFIMFGKSSKAL